jgi:hypothetical protein
MRCHSSTPRTKDGGYVGAWYFPLTEGEPAVTIKDVKCAEVFPPLLSAGSKDVDFDRLRLVSSLPRSFNLWWGGPEGLLYCHRGLLPTPGTTLGEAVGPRGLAWRRGVSPSTA